MVSSEMLRRVALVRNDVSEERSASHIMVARIGELGTTLALTSNRRTLRRNRASVVRSSLILVTLMKEALSSSKTWILTRATRRNIPEDTILHSHRRENLKTYISEICLALCKNSFGFHKMLGTTEWLHMFWPLERYSAPQS
jgi:hypothetical protein